MSSVYTSVSGQDAVFKQMQVIANNLANMSTSGFKAERLKFEQALSSSRPTESSLKKEIAEPSSMQTSFYAKTAGSYTDFTQGAIETTHDPLNVALQGDGLFAVATADGERYTRAGEFKLATDGRLVTPQGFPVQGSGGEIVVSGGTPNILEDGTVMVAGASVGKIRVVKIDPSELTREAAQLFKLKDGASVAEAPETRMVSGAVESSNVNATRELTDMIMASRAFDSLQKTRESDSKMSKARAEAFGKG